MSLFLGSTLLQIFMEHLVNNYCLKKVFVTKWYYFQWNCCKRIKTIPFSSLFISGVPALLNRRQALIYIERLLGWIYIMLPINSNIQNHFWYFLETSDRKLYSHEIPPFVLFPSAILAREITEHFRKINTRINDLRENVLYYWLLGYIQPSNLSSGLFNVTVSEYIH